jgi:hypothetical protein
MNWEELKAYYSSTELAQSQLDTKFKAGRLKDKMLNYKKYLFFQSAIPVVQELEMPNRMFQQNTAVHHELYQQIFLHLKSLHKDVKNRKKKYVHQINLVSNS